MKQYGVRVYTIFSAQQAAQGRKMSSNMHMNLFISQRLAKA